MILNPTPRLADALAAAELATLKRLTAAIENEETPLDEVRKNAVTIRDIRREFNVALKAAAVRDAAVRRAEAVENAARTRADALVRAADRRTRASVRTAKIRADAADRAAKLRADAVKHKGEIINDPDPRAPYGRHPDGRPVTHDEFCQNLDEAVADIYGLNLNLAELGRHAMTAAAHRGLSFGSPRNLPSGDDDRRAADHRAEAVDNAACAAQHHAPTNIMPRPPQSNPQNPQSEIPPNRVPRSSATSP